MSLRVIHGKPGSGKSCYCVSLIVKILEDWARYKQEKSEPYPSVLYTNIPLDIEAVNSYLTDVLCTEIDISEQIEILDDSFFRDKSGEYCNWWEKIEGAALVVIDEVHHYLPSGLKTDKAGKELAKQFVNYVSMHRHNQHDLIFLSQHLNNVTSEVKRMTEVIYEVLNVKNMNFGYWPFIIQMSDIDTVREAWGFPVQLAHIKRGVCSANSVQYDKTCEQFILSPSLFKLYRSHTKSDEAFDRPSLKLGRVGSLLWLFRRYFFRFAMYTIILITVIAAGRQALAELPNILVKAIVGGNSVNVDNLTNDVTFPTVPVTSAGGSHEHHSHIGSGEPSAALSEFSDPTTDDIVGFLPGGVITRKGILKRDDHIIYKGERDYVKQVDVMRGILYLGSGNKVQK
jgi:zona occludens toxin (predicted ATPase)